MAARRTRKPKGEVATVDEGAAIPALPDDIANRYADYIDRDAKAASIAGGGMPFISTRGGRFTYQEEILEGPLEVIILGSIRENQFFEGDFNPDEPNAPTCYALGYEDDELGPPEELEGAQSKDCASCWANAWGSGDRNRSKACKNAVRLTLLPANDLAAKALSTVDGARLRIPPTSLRNWSKYAGKVARGLKRPLFTMVTAINIEPDPKTQFKITFDAHAPIQDAELFDAIEGRLDESKESLEMTPASAADGDDEKSSGKPAQRRRKVEPKAGSKKATKKKAGKKAARKF